MDSITRMVDIPNVFERLHELPVELATARHNIWLETQELADETARHNETQAIALEAAAEDYAACKNPEQRDLFKQLLFKRDASVIVAESNMLTVQAELDASKTWLADLKDEQTSLRYTIRLISALTLGTDTMPANVLYDKLLDALLDKREGTILVTTTTTLPEFSNDEKYDEYAEFASGPDDDDGLPF